MIDYRDTVNRMHQAIKDASESAGRLSYQSASGYAKLALFYHDWLTDEGYEVLTAGTVRDLETIARY